MKIPFTKMHGAGNDFVVLDATRQTLDLTGAQYRAIADRHFGVGADQILLVCDAPAALADVPRVDFAYRIFNADGAEVEQCGNGARAFVRFVHDQKLSEKNPLLVATKAGVIEPFQEQDGTVTVAMGPPSFELSRIPFDNLDLVSRRQGKLDLWPLDLGFGEIEVAVASMGNPHAVRIVDDVARAAVAREGPVIERHARFVKHVNAGFMQIIGRSEIALRVWERGVGETLACGTGACAAAVVGMMLGELDSAVTVHTKGGELRITWQGPGTPVCMNGPVVSVFEGVLDLSSLPDGL